MLKPNEELTHMGNLYVTDSCNRFEEDNHTRDYIERAYREKVLDVIPLYCIRNKVTGEYE